jgi:cell division protein FtsW
VTDDYGLTTDDFQKMSIQQRIQAELKGDPAIWMVVIVLSIFSTLAVYSASGSLVWRSDGAQSTTTILLSHIARLGAGVGIVYLLHLVHYRRYQSLARPLLALTLFLLPLTLLVGSNINQAKRWLTVPGLDVSFQTSDFAKIALVIYIARMLTQKQEYITSFKEAFLPIIIPVLLVCGLIAPANLSTALILFSTSIVLMFIGRVSVKYIFLLGALGIVLFAGLLVLGELKPDLVRSATWEKRLEEFMTKEDGGDQVREAKTAIARGGWVGVGPGNSLSRNFLPYSYADFIYAIICEEYGLFGGVLILAMYLIMFFRTVKLATKSPKAFGTFLAIGLSLTITVQALANIAVAVNLVPVTGLTLPLISMGGTSLFFTSIAFGMILSVSKFVENYDADLGYE